MVRIPRQMFPSVLSNVMANCYLPEYILLLTLTIIPIIAAGGGRSDESLLLGDLAE